MNKTDKEYQSALHWLKLKSCLHQIQDRARDASKYVSDYNVDMVKAEIYYLNLYLEQVKQSIMKVE